MTLRHAVKKAHGERKTEALRSIARLDGQQKRKELFTMEKLTEYLPFLIPLVILQLSLLAYVLHHILTHNTYKRGTRLMWTVISIVLMGFVGPILYLMFGREDS